MSETEWPPEAVIALAKEVGIKEAARRTGRGSTTIHRWVHQGPPAPKRERPPAVPPDARGSGTAERADTERPPGWRDEWQRRRGQPQAAPPPPRLLRAPTPEEVPRDERLTPQQCVALHLLLCGYHTGDIVTAMGISEWELLAWRRSPDFRAAHKAGLAEMQALAVESGMAFGAMALDHLYRIGMDPTVPERTRGMCLAAYLDRAGWAKTKRLEVHATGPAAGELVGTPPEQLDAMEREARQELELIQGGKA